jgi:undecaprenyl-diphosphatase
VLGLGVLYLACLGTFAYLVRGADDLPGELSATLWIQSWRTPWLDSVMTAVSTPGFWALGLPILGVITAAFFVKGWRKESVLLLAATLAATLVVTVIGEAVARARPSAEIVWISGDTDGYSFPSGHVTSYVVVLGALALFSTRSIRQRAFRWLVHASLILALVAVGISRIYLGAHWVSDVVAGYAVGMAILAGIFSLWRRWSSSRD